MEASYAERRLEELDLVTVLTESLEAIGFTLPPDVVDHIVGSDHSAYSNSLEVPAGDDRAPSSRLREEGYGLGLVSNVALLPHHMRGRLDALGLAAVPRRDDVLQRGRGPKARPADLPVRAGAPSA